MAMVWGEIPITEQAMFDGVVKSQKMTFHIM